MEHAAWSREGLSFQTSGQIPYRIQSYSSACPFDHTAFGVSGKVWIP